MPEATLGLGLAGGLSYALPRLLGGNQQLALCLALTGMALEGPDLFFSQIATNYMTHRRLDMMMERLAEVRRRCLTRCFWPEASQRIVSMFGSGWVVPSVIGAKPDIPRLACSARVSPCLHAQINQDPKPFGDRTPDCSEDPTAVQTLLERSGDLSWNIDGLPDDCLDPTESQIPITRFVHELLPQVSGVHAHRAGLITAILRVAACYTPFVCRFACFVNDFRMLRMTP